jgi:hypothetical protein
VPAALPALTSTRLFSLSLWGGILFLLVSFRNILTGGIEKLEVVNFWSTKTK